MATTITYNEESDDRPVRRVVKAATVAVPANALEADDEFVSIYGRAGMGPSVLTPPYPPRRLGRLTQENNALGPCIDAMEANIAGTGWAVRFREDVDETEELEEKRKAVEAFFKEPTPGKSFTTVRRRCVRDREKTGNGYYEVTRDGAGNIAFVRHLRTEPTRLVKLDDDDAVDVPVTVSRDGEQRELTYRRRERRYVQVTAGRVVYYKEFGATRDLDVDKGEWAPAGSLPLDKRATEIIHMTVHEDETSPYGVPRWIGQLPSVLGSRQAEEYNYEFFLSGGVPPGIIFVEGGLLATHSRQDLEEFLSGGAKRVNRIPVLESTAQSVGDKEPKVTIRVERFGAEKQEDSMFEKYDERCEIRIRRAFRLPPLFVGAAGDYSFATAFASYVVAEAQVFQPEREEEDEVINNTIMRELDPDRNFEFVSMPLSVTAVETKLEAIGIAREANLWNKDDLAHALSDVTGMDIAVSEDMDDDTMIDQVADRLRQAMQPANDPGAPPGQQQSEPVDPPATGNPAPVSRDEQVSKLHRLNDEQILALAKRAKTAIRLAAADSAEGADVVQVQREVEALTDEDQQAFRQVLGMLMFANAERAPEDLARIAGCTLAMAAGQRAA